MSEKIKLENIRTWISDKLDEIGIFKKYKGNDILIEEVATNSDLKKIIVENIPKANVWIFYNELDRSSGKKVEKSILFYHDNKLYVVMIEMKETITARNFQKVKKKCEDSLCTISIHIAANPDFDQFKETILFPIGVCCYNKEDCDEINEYNKTDGNLSTSTIFKQNYVDKQLREFYIQIQPVLLDIYRIPVIFFQNPNQEPLTNSFIIDFKEILNRADECSK